MIRILKRLLTSRASRTLSAAKRSPDVAARRRKAVVAHLNTFGPYRRGVL